MIIEEVVSYLELNGYGTFKKDLFGVSMPNSPDECVCVYDNAGYEPGINFDSVTEYPCFQIISRAKNYKIAYEKLYNIYKFLNGDTGLYIFIEAEQSPAGIGKDENGRFEVSCNFKITREVK